MNTSEQKIVTKTKPMWKGILSLELQLQVKQDLDWIESLKREKKENKKIPKLQTSTDITAGSKFEKTLDDSSQGHREGNEQVCFQSRWVKEQINSKQHTRWRKIKKSYVPRLARLKDIGVNRM